MVSPTKVRDRDNRILFLETMEVALRLGNIEMAKTFGEHSSFMKQKIETHDYTADDQQYERVTKIIKGK